MVKLDWCDCEAAANKIAEYIHSDHPQTNVRLYGVPRGGVYAAILVGQSLAILGRNPVQVDSPVGADYIIDDLIDSGKTREGYLHYKAGFQTLFLKTLMQKKGSIWYSFPWERMAGNKEETVEDNIVRVLQFLGEDVEREGLKETPSRVVKSWDKIFGGYKDKAIDHMTTFKETNNEMVILKDIEFYSTCEHHMLPFFGKAHIGYLPNGKVIGVSKLARVLEVFARRLQIQERIGQQVTSAIMTGLGTEDCACVLEAQHFCMTSRGVEKQNSIMLTSSLRGAFLNDAMVRSEFRGMIGK